MAASVRRFGTGEVRSVAVSAATGEGVTGLQGVIAECLAGGRVLKRLRLPPTSYRLRAQVYSLARVESERIDEDGHCVLDITRARRDLGFEPSYDPASMVAAYVSMMDRIGVEPIAT